MCFASGEVAAEGGPSTAAKSTATVREHTSRCSFCRWYSVVSKVDFSINGLQRLIVKGVHNLRGPDRRSRLLLRVRILDLAGTQRAEPPVRVAR